MATTAALRHSHNTEDEGARRAMRPAHPQHFRELSRIFLFGADFLNGDDGSTGAGQVEGVTGGETPAKLKGEIFFLLFYFVFWGRVNYLHATII